MYQHLHFTQSLDPAYGGGLTTSVLSLHQSMLDIGLSSYIVSTYRRKEDLDFSLLPANTFAFQESIATPFFIAFQAAKLIKESLLAQPTIYHSHGLHTYLQFAFRASKIPSHSRLVIHPHGFFEPYIRARSRIKKRIVSLAYESNNFRKAFLWRALTQVESDQILSLHPVSNIATIPNGIEMPDFSSKIIDKPYSLSLASDERHILLFMGRLHPKKGLDTLLNSWSQLSEFHRTWKLVIAGPSWQASYDKQISDQVRSLQLNDCIQLIGPVYGAEKDNLLRLSSLFVLPSLSEGFPVALLEAAAYGLPIIMTKACNIVEFIESKHVGVCNHSVDDLTSCIRKRLNMSHSELSQHGQALAAMVKNSFTWRTIANQLHTLSTMSS